LYAQWHLHWCISRRKMKKKKIFYTTNKMLNKQKKKKSMLFSLLGISKLDFFFWTNKILLILFVRIDLVKFSFFSSLQEDSMLYRSTRVLRDDKKLSQIIWSSLYNSSLLKSLINLFVTFCYFLLLFVKLIIF
jgi:hypothetical protein